MTKTESEFSKKKIAYFMKTFYNQIHKNKLVFYFLQV